MKIRFFVILIIIAFIISGCTFQPNLIGIKTNNSSYMLKITSPSFENGGQIPSMFTCDGENINPEILIDNLPTSTQSLVLIVDDPDAPAGTWTHWLVFNINDIDFKSTKINQNSQPDGSIMGLNDFQTVNYSGPCPPSGRHRYFFRVYALDDILPLIANTNRQEIEQAMIGHVLDSGELYGYYQRTK